MLNPSTDPDYTGKVNAPDNDYPNGSARDAAIENDPAATPLLAKKFNDDWGFDAALLAAAGIAPSGDPDNAEESQRMQAMSIVSGANGTIAAMAGGAYPTGAVVTLAERGGSVWDVLASGTPTGYGVLDAGNGKVAVPRTDGEVSILTFGGYAGAPTATNDAAMAAAHATGEVVYYPGVTGVTYQFTKLGSPILYGGIRGDGMTKTVLEYTDATSADAMTFDGRWEAFFPTQDESAFVFEDFAMVGPSTGGVPDKVGGHSIKVTAPSAEPDQRENQATTFKHVMFRQVFGGVHFFAASYWRVEGCIFNTYVGQGVLVENRYDADSGDGYIGGGSVFVTNPTADGAAGVRQYSGGGLKFTDSKVLGGTYGYRLEYDTTATTGAKKTSNLQITGVSMELMQFGAISLTSDGVHPFKLIVISDNEIALTTYGVASDATGFLSTMVIADNVIEVWAGYTAAEYFCIGLDGATGVTISGNTLTGVGGVSKGVSLVNCVNTKIGVNTYISLPDPIAVTGGSVTVTKDTKSGADTSTATGWIGYGPALFQSPINTVTYDTPFLIAPEVGDIQLTAGEGTWTVGGVVASSSKTGFTYVALAIAQDVPAVVNWCAKGVA